MADFGSQPNAEFDQGVNHVVNPVRSNVNSITLDGALQADGDEWNSAVGYVATTPHAALAPFAFSRNASPNASDGSHFVPGYGYTGSGDGDSADTYDKNMSLRMVGDRAAELD